MLITFTSRKSASVMMFGEIAKQMMRLVGKEPTDQGTVTVADLPAAIAKLKAAIALDRGGAQVTTSDDSEEIAVGAAQRALPLLTLFEESLKGDAPVVWGV